MFKYVVRHNMAKISFSLTRTEAALMHLEQTLQNKVKHEGENIVVVFDNVEEKLALWLLTYGIAYHGLAPEPPKDTPINMMEVPTEAHPPTEQEVHKGPIRTAVVLDMPVVTRVKTDPAKRVSLADGKGD